MPSLGNQDFTQQTGRLNHRSHQGDLRRLHSHLTASWWMVGGGSGKQHTQQIQTNTHVLYMLSYIYMRYQMVHLHLIDTCCVPGLNHGEITMCFFLRGSVGSMSFSICPPVN